MVISFAMAGQAREYHVSIKGNDQSIGTEMSPFQTIGRAAQVAYPGDGITVHAGVYREWINPSRGGDSDDNRIVSYTGRRLVNASIEMSISNMRYHSIRKSINGYFPISLPDVSD